MLSMRLIPRVHQWAAQSGFQPYALLKIVGTLGDLKTRFLTELPQTNPAGAADDMPSSEERQQA